MRKLKIMNATFEESLNLLDDPFIQYMIQDVEKPDIKEKPLLLRILAFVFIIILYVISSFATNSVKQGYIDSPIPKPEINFLPTHVFFVLLLLFLLIWRWTLPNRIRSTNFFWTYINTTNFLRWLIIEFNLLFLTMFFKPLTLIGVSILFFFVCLVGYFIYRSKLIALENSLFDTKSKPNKIDNFIRKTINLLLKYGWIIVIIVILWKFILPNTAGIRTDIVGFISILAMWIGFDIVFIVAEMYLFLPYLLYGYYKTKYPEEYRDWEGKSQIDWYGEKYFNRYTKNTEKEEKRND